MLRVTADVYSGRTNPFWIIKNESLARKMVKEAKGVLAASNAKNLRIQPKLGFRGLIIEPVKGEKLMTGQSSVGFAPSKAADAAIEIPVELAAELRGRDLIERLLQTMMAPGVDARSVSGVDAGSAQGLRIGTESIASLQRFLLDQLAGRRQDAAQQGQGAIAPEDLRAIGCLYETSVYDPGLWNNDPTVRSNNNCYNYACNRVTNTYARPGRGCGNELLSPGIGAHVVTAALCDGLRRRHDCLPDSENPRHLVALVIWPGHDFHWYRYNQQGQWSHKRGTYPATNVDNAGQVISDPSICDRSPYTEFCGYFYVGTSARIA